MKEFRRLTVWEKAHALTLAIYQCDRDVSERRDLRHQQPNATVQRVGCSQYCRGMRPYRKRRFSSLPEYGSRFAVLNWNTLYCYPATWVSHHLNFIKA